MRPSASPPDPRSESREKTARGDRAQATEPSQQPPATGARTVKPGTEALSRKEAGSDSSMRHRGRQRGPTPTPEAAGWAAGSRQGRRERGCYSRGRRNLRQQLLHSQKKKKAKKTNQNKRTRPTGAAPLFWLCFLSQHGPVGCVSPLSQGSARRSSEEEATRRHRSYRFFLSIVVDPRFSSRCSSYSLFLSLVLSLSFIASLPPPKRRQEARALLLARGRERCPPERLRKTSLDRRRRSSCQLEPGRRHCR